MKKSDPEAAKQPTTEDEGDDASVADNSASDSHQTSTNDDSDKTKGLGSLLMDKFLLRGKVAAFFILGLAAVGLGAMTFFLTRGEEMDNFENQVSLQFSVPFCRRMILSPCVSHPRSVRRLCDGDH